MALIGRVRRGLDFDRQARVGGCEPLDLAAEHNPFSAQRAAGYREDVGARSACGGHPERGCDHEPRRQSHQSLGLAPQMPTPGNLRR